MLNRMKKILNRGKGESGQSTVLFAVAMVVLMGFTALSVDVGRV